MKTKVVLACASVVLAVLVTFLLVSPPSASAGIDPVPFLAPMGFARSQSIQVNVGHVRGILPCVVELGFADSEGHLIVNDRGEAISKTVQLSPGQSDFLVLSGREFNDGQRKFVCPVVDVIRPDEQSVVAVTAEIFNNVGGKTVSGVSGIDPVPFAER